MSEKNIKKPYKKKSYSSSKKYSKKAGVSSDIKKLKKDLNKLKKTASPEWLTCKLIDDYVYSSATTMSWKGINQDSGSGYYLGPRYVGTGDGTIRGEGLEYKYLELNLSFLIGPDAIGGIVPAGGLLPTGNSSMPGAVDYYFGNRIRIMIVCNNCNAGTGNGTLAQGPQIQNLLETNSYAPSVGNRYLDLIGAYYDEDTGGKKKDHWVLYDEIINMEKLGTVNENIGAATTGPVLAGEYTHRIKMDLKHLPRAKVLQYFTTGGQQTPDLFDYGMLSLHVFSNKAGPITSATYNTAYSDRWYFGATGRLVYTCP